MPASDSPAPQGPFGTTAVASWGLDDDDAGYGLGVEAALPFFAASVGGAGAGAASPPSCSPAPAVR
ncbi:MAG: hypothetical protein ABI696_06295 [Rubrivivax sp.]